MVIRSKYSFDERDCVLNNVNLMYFQTDDQTTFRKFLCMDADQFNNLFQLVAPHILKLSMQFWQAVIPRERLSITMRYLATGKNQSCGCS